MGQRFRYGLKHKVLSNYSIYRMKGKTPMKMSEPGGLPEVSWGRFSERARGFATDRLDPSAAVSQ